ncbi:DWNN domain-containing protein [Dipodascopsis uninucleata]
MSSFVYYKFRSQKEPQRIIFDGTGISVFDLKHEVIAANKLGDGTDFDLSIYNPDTNEEYEDDTEVLPRSSFVIVRRRPPSKPGKGTAARYVSGRGPIISSSLRRGTDSFSSKRPLAVSQNERKSDGPASEEDMINAILQAETDNWMQTQEKMASATPVFNGRPNARQRPAAPDHPPPAGYVCYRCGQKGHWIQTCPTNSDPNWEHRRVKRTTGIPRSFLKTVSKEELTASNNSGGSGLEKVMINEDGDYVVVQPDSAAWQSYLLKQRKEYNEGEYGDDEDADGERKKKRSRRSDEALA